MGLHWTFRKAGANGCDRIADIVIDVDAVLSRTGKSVIAYEWVAYRITRPLQHEVIARSEVHYKKHRPTTRTRKDAIQAAETWYDAYVQNKAA